MAVSVASISDEIQNRVNHEQLELRSRRLKLAFKSQKVYQALHPPCAKSVHRRQSVLQPAVECGAEKKAPHPAEFWKGEIKLANSKSLPAAACR